jgi:hypothetical protein
MIYFKDALTKFANAHNERLLNTPNNPISMGKHSDRVHVTSYQAITLNSFAAHSPTMLGSMLFSRFVSGTR